MDGIQQIKRNTELLSYLYCSDACVLLYLLYSIKKILQWKWNQVPPSLHYLISEGPELSLTLHWLALW